MDPSWDIWKYGWLEFMDLTQNKGSERVFGWKFGTDPCWGNQKDLLLESVMVRRSGERMEVWLGSPK